jgi:putative PIN family toxin of toxin-antitoxin system
MRVVVDTNVWVSGLLWKGLPWRLLRLAEAEKVEIWATPSMLLELETVLRRPQFEARRRELDLETWEIVAYAATLVSLVDLERIEPIVAADPDDDVFVNCALVVGAGYLISGDGHLLDLEEWEGISIVTPREFFDELPHLLNE